MPSSDRASGRRSGTAAVSGLAAAALVGFVLAVSADPHTDSVLTVGVVIVAALLVAALVTRTRASAPTLTIAGAVAALTSTWLLPQRDDPGSAVVLTVLFAVGVCVVAGAFERQRASPVIALVAGVALVVVRLAGSQVALLIATAFAVVLATGIAVLAQPRRPRAGRPLVLTTVLLVVTVVFAGYVGAETPDASWFGGGIVHGPTDGRDVALTFDDGPNIDATPKIIAILDRYGVKGTFFEVGKAIDAQPSITRMLYGDGQLLGNHSYHHDDWRWLDPRYPELERTQDAFKRAIGTCPTLYRPPHGERTPFLARVVHDHHMHMVLWSVSAGDWATSDPRTVARRILARARPGAILLLHDGLDGNPTANREVLVQAMPLILDGLRAAHLTPVRLDQLLGVPAYMSCR